MKKAYEPNEVAKLILYHLKILTYKWTDYFLDGGMEC